MGYLVVAVVATAITVFALQNNTPVTVRFVAWKLETVSLAAVILVSLAAGLVVAGLPLWFRVWRLRRRLRAALAVADAAAVPPPPRDAGPPLPPAPPRG